MEAAVQSTVEPTRSTGAENLEGSVQDVTSEMVDLQSELSRLNSMGLLCGLLKDKTTGGNITWATDQYEGRGYRYAKDQPIQTELILGVIYDVVRARAAKSREDQLKRTRKKGEVFTPIWVVDKMTSHILADAHKSAKNWKQFIDFRMLEITCGEGPFLATRYDTETGKVIPLHKRVGLLDAKLREVTANTGDEQTWAEWAVRAFESTYGYEYQGDSLLIARINMVMTFLEYFESRWDHAPENELLRRISNVVAWNLWQMDGLTGRAPTTTVLAPVQKQMSMFEDMTTLAPSIEHIECRIYDWRANRSQKWSELR